MTNLYDALEKLFFTSEELSNRKRASNKTKNNFETKLRQKVEEKIGSEDMKTLEDYVVTNANDQRMKNMAEAILDEVACSACSLEIKFGWKACSGMLRVMHKYFKESNYDLAQASETACTTLYDREIEEILEDVYGGGDLIF